MKNSNFALSTSLGIYSLSLLTACSPKSKEIQRPNIIFIMSDDHAWQAVSAYGSRLKEVAPTPNIDRIAAWGIRFDRCLVTNSICGPSRAVILTGKYSHLNGFLTNERESFNGAQQTFPKLLQQAGYQTAIIGKWHLGSEPTGFDHWDILPGQGNYYNPDFIHPGGKYQEQGYVTDIITDKSLEWISKAKDAGKPFMIMIHNKAPHRQWEPGPKYLHSFEGVNFPEPETLFDDYSGRGSAAHQQDMTIARTMTIDSDLKMWNDTSARAFKGTIGRMNAEQRKNWDATYLPLKEKFEKLNPKGDDLIRWKYQRYMYDYLACIKSIDENVGRVLDYLKKTGLDKNTIIIYNSDQGFYLGEHGWFDKRFMFEESYRSPLLVSWPGVTQPGSVNKDIVSNLDFAETFLDAAGVPIPGDMQGLSLIPLLKGNTSTDWRKEHYYHYYEFPFGWHSVKRHYGISTERYKLIHYYNDVDEWEMYDLKADPQEMRSVYNDPAYAGIRDSLHARLNKIRIMYKDSDEIERTLLPEKK